MVERIRFSAPVSKANELLVFVFVSFQKGFVDVLITTPAQRSWS